MTPIHHKLTVVRSKGDQILTSKNFVVLEGTGTSKDYFDIEVYPGDMEWTITRVDTGDGTNWFKTAPVSGTGNYADFEVEKMLDNPGSERSAQITISDDSAGATDKTVTVTQLIAPS